jgi:hypothetical protein
MLSRWLPPQASAHAPEIDFVLVWLSEPRSVLPGRPNRSMCTTWLMPFPDRLNQ